LRREVVEQRLGVGAGLIVVADTMTTFDRFADCVRSSLLTIS